MDVWTSLLIYALLTHFHSDHLGSVKGAVPGAHEHGMDMERFEVGSKEQFVLKNTPRRYRNLFDENMPSCGVRIRYGKFTYYNCGDLSGLNFPRYKCQERDFESEVAKVVGKISVMKCDHHAATDVVNENLLRAARPDAMIVIAGHREHPYPSTMERMIDKSIYPDERDLYITTECSKEDLGEALWSNFKPAGHIVVRVYPGGKKYQIFVLDVFSDDYKIKYTSTVRTL